MFRLSPRKNHIQVPIAFEFSLQKTIPSQSKQNDLSHWDIVKMELINRMDVSILPVTFHRFPQFVNSIRKLPLAFGPIRYFNLNSVDFPFAYHQRNQTSTTFCHSHTNALKRSVVHLFIFSSGWAYAIAYCINEF